MAQVRMVLTSRAADVDCFFSGDAPRNLVKKNSSRTIWRVKAGEPALYVKQFPRELLRDRAKHEATMLDALTKAGIPCPRLVATARDSEGTYVITEEVPDAQILKALLLGGGSVVRPLLASLADVARRLHEAGFDHRDFHVGNVLVRDGALIVLDVHRARRVRSISRMRQLNSIAFTAMSFIDLVPFTDVARFLHRFGVDRTEMRQVLVHLRRHLERHWCSRQERCLRESTGFGMRDGMHYRRGTNLEAILAAIKRGGDLVRRTAREQLIRLPQGWFVKVTPRAKCIWVNGNGLLVRGVAVPLLHAFGPGWVVGDWVNAPNVGDFIRERFSQLGRCGRDEFIFRLARFIRCMHERGVFHRDLKTANVLVANDGFCVIDFDRIKFGMNVAERHRLLNLAQLNAAVPATQVTRSDRLRFLRAYIGRDRMLANCRRNWIRRIMKITIKRRHNWP